MSINFGSSSHINLGSAWELSAQTEETDVVDDGFVLRYGKQFKITVLVLSIIATIGGIFMFFLIDKALGGLFLALGIAGCLVLPTVYSYRCFVNKTVMIEKYYIVFISIEKEILWEDVKYRKISNAEGDSHIKLYDENKKKLISFEGALVGYNQIFKLAKRSRIKDIE